ncbi:MAG: uroporphyrinogen decarboxylase family protein [Eubacteriales bacterium]
MTERKVYDDPIALRKERKQLVEDAVRHDRKPKRIPIMSNAWTWIACDAGYTFTEYFYDYDKNFDAVCQLHEKYEMDMYVEMGARNPFRVADCFGPSLYKIDDEHNHLSISDFNMMDEDDYDDIIKLGTRKFFFERGIPSRYGITDKEQMMEAYGKAAKEFLTLGEHNKRVTNQFVDNFGVPNMCAGKVPFPMESMICTLRGIRGLSKDMRTRPERLQELLEVINSEQYVAVEKLLDTIDPTDDRFSLPLRLTSLSHTIQSTKQFEKFSWPYIKNFVDQISKRNWIGWLFLEGTIDHIIDFLRDIPKGCIGIQIESNDPVEIKKKLPNVTIAGGFPQRLLYGGTKQQCIDKAKQLIDEMAYDGNYIFTVDKMMSYPEDGKGENLKAVVDFVKEYSKF